MVVVEANAPSGFTIDEDALRHLTSIKDLQRVETAKGGTIGNIYINSVGRILIIFHGIVIALIPFLDEFGSDMLQYFLRTGFSSG